MRWWWITDALGRFVWVLGFRSSFKDGQIINTQYQEIITRDLI